MAMSKSEITKHITSAISDAVVELRDLMGDGEHWSLTVSSSSFKGLSMVAQHKMIYSALNGKMGEQLHALQIKTKVI